MQKTENELLKDVIELLREIIKAQGGTGKCSSYWVETQMRKLEDIKNKMENHEKTL